MAQSKTKKTATRISGKQSRGKSLSSRSKSRGTSSTNILPLFLIGAILGALGVIAYLGYQTVTASDFFEVRSINIAGTTRASKENIERFVETQTVKSGVWNADLPLLKAEIEKMPFVRTAAVSRVLPNGLRVEVEEFTPKAIVKLKKGDHLVADDGRVLAQAAATETELPYVMTGWDEAKSPEAEKENLERLKLYQKTLDEWQTFGIVEKVKQFDVTDIRDPKAMIDDSGVTVAIAVGRSNFGENLSRGIKAIVGKGLTFEAVDLLGSNMTLVPRGTAKTDTKTAPAKQGK